MSLIKEQAWCICCILNQTPNRPATTIHHPSEGGMRTGKTMGLCPWHHQAVLDHGFSKHDMQVRFGASLAHGSREFHEVWASEPMLVRLQDYLIELWLDSGPWETYNLPRYVQYELRRRLDEMVRGPSQGMV